MDDALARAKRRRRKAVPGVVVTAATLGTTGLAFAYSVKTAPAQNTATSPSPAVVAAELAHERAGIARLQALITSDEGQIEALRQSAATENVVPASTGSAPAAGSPGGSTDPLVGTSAAAPGATSGAPATAPPAGSTGGVVAPSAPAPAPAPPVAQPPAPAPAPPPPVTATTGASGG